MKQYVRFKTEHPECLLLFRMGDFYELFGEDAVVAHEALGITLTERTKGMPMAGVPHHAMEGYLRRLVEGGYRVAICDQVQDPKEAKGVVDRAVTRVLTPGTLVDESMLDDAAPNHLAAVHRVVRRAAEHRDERRGGGRGRDVRAQPAVGDEHRDRRGRVPVDVDRARGEQLGEAAEAEALVLHVPGREEGGA